MLCLQSVPVSGFLITELFQLHRTVRNNSSNDIDNSEMRLFHVICSLLSTAGALADIQSRRADFPVPLWNWPMPRQATGPCACPLTRLNLSSHQQSVSCSRRNVVLLHSDPMSDGLDASAVFAQLRGSLTVVDPFTVSEFLKASYPHFIIRPVITSPEDWLSVALDDVTLWEWVQSGLSGSVVQLFCLRVAESHDVKAIWGPKKVQCV